MKKSLKTIAIGTLIAGAAGYVAGLLTAPKSGRETRKDLKIAADRTISETEKHLKKLNHELSDLLDEAKSRGNDVKGKAKSELDDLTEMGNSAKQKARELLSALHEGDADDKDLKKAMNEASKAITHLRKYLKK